MNGEGAREGGGRLEASLRATFVQAKGDYDHSSFIILYSPFPFCFLRFYRKFARIVKTQQISQF